MSSDPFAVTLKTAVNTRAPLSERVPQKFHNNNININNNNNNINNNNINENQTEVVPAISALHRSILTTYDAAYCTTPARTDPSEGNLYLSLLRSKKFGNNNNNNNNNTGFCNSPTNKSKTVTIKSHDDDDNNNNNNNNGSSSPSVTDTNNNNINSNNNIINNNKSHSNDASLLISTQHLPKDWRSEQQSASTSVFLQNINNNNNNKDNNSNELYSFYSKARKIEQRDDELRTGLVGNTQRTVDIMRRRANNPELFPPKDIFYNNNNNNNISLIRPMKECDASGRPARFCLDIVDCTQLAPETEHAIGFNSAPISRLSNINNNNNNNNNNQTCYERTKLKLLKSKVKETETNINNNNNINISQDITTQQRVLTAMATSHQLFAGTPKVWESAIPHYAGHVPKYHNNNIGNINNNNINNNNNNINNNNATTTDTTTTNTTTDMNNNNNINSDNNNNNTILFQISNISTHDTDPLRQYSKSYMTLATHGGGIDARNNCKNPLVRSKSGSKAKPAKELPPKNIKTILQTVEGEMLQIPIIATTKEERGLNRRVDKDKERGIIM